MTDNNQQTSSEEPKKLGIAGNIAKQFIVSPVTPLLMFAFLAIGVIGLMLTPRQEDPKISVPMVDVYIQYPGASAEQVSSLVTEPFERLLSELDGVRHVYSATQRGSTIVTVQFKVGEDFGHSIVKVHDKIQSNIDRTPPGVSIPLVKPVGIDDVPIVTITLWSDPQKGGVDDGTLRMLAFDVLQQLQSLPNTGNSFVVGGRSDQIRIEVSPERLSGFDISLAQVARRRQYFIQGIQWCLFEYGGGDFQAGDWRARWRPCLCPGYRPGDSLPGRDKAISELLHRCGQRGPPTGKW